VCGRDWISDFVSPVLAAGTYWTVRQYVIFIGLKAGTVELSLGLS